MAWQWILFTFCGLTSHLGGTVCQGGNQGRRGRHCRPYPTMPCHLPHRTVGRPNAHCARIACHHCPLFPAHELPGISQTNKHYGMPFPIRTLVVACLPYVLDFSPSSCSLSHFLIPDLIPSPFSPLTHLLSPFLFPSPHLPHPTLTWF